MYPSSLDSLVNERPDRWSFLSGLQNNIFASGSSSLDWFDPQPQPGLFSVSSNLYDESFDPDSVYNRPGVSSSGIVADISLPQAAPVFTYTYPSSATSSYDPLDLPDGYFGYASYATHPIPQGSTLGTSQPDRSNAVVTPSQLLIDLTGAGGIIDLTEYDADFAPVESDGLESSSSSSIPPTPAMPVPELYWSPLDRSENELDMVPPNHLPSPTYSAIDLPPTPSNAPSRKRKLVNARSDAESEYHASDDGSEEDEGDEYVEKRRTKRVKKSPAVPRAPAKKTKRKTKPTSSRSSRSRTSHRNVDNGRLLQLLGNGDSDECIFCAASPGRGQDLVRHIQSVHYKDGDSATTKEPGCALKDGWTTASLTDHLRPIIAGDPTLLEKELAKYCLFCSSKLSRIDACNRHMRDRHPNEYNEYLRKAPAV